MNTRSGRVSSGSSNTLIVMNCSTPLRFTLPPPSTSSTTPTAVRFYPPTLAKLFAFSTTTIIGPFSAARFTRRQSAGLSSTVPTTLNTRQRMHMPGRSLLFSRLSSRTLNTDKFLSNTNPGIADPLPSHTWRYSWASALSYLPSMSTSCTTT